MNDLQECVVCGMECAPAGKAEACIFCFTTGRYFEQVLLSDERSNMLQKIRDLGCVVRAEVWHNGMGAFSLAVQLQDGRLVLPGLFVQIGSQVLVNPVIPTVGDSWGLTVAASVAPEEEDLTFMSDSFDDVGVVTAIEQLASLNAMLEGK